MYAVYPCSISFCAPTSSEERAHKYIDRFGYTTQQDYLSVLCTPFNTPIESPLTTLVVDVSLAYYFFFFSLHWISKLDGWTDGPVVKSPMRFHTTRNWLSTIFLSIVSSDLISFFFFFLRYADNHWPTAIQINCIPCNLSKIQEGPVLYLHTEAYCRKQMCEETSIRSVFWANLLVCQYR